MNKILIGSQYFFSKYSDFKGKDIDFIEIIDTTDFNHKRQLTGHKQCIFQLRQKAHKDDYISWDLKENLGMSAGKYLVPEFCDLIGFTIDDLPKILPLIQKLDRNHLYERCIYNSYINNKTFVLTPEQLDEAYLLYKKARSE